MKTLITLILLCNTCYGQVWSFFVDENGHIVDKLNNTDTIPKYTINKGLIVGSIQSKTTLDTVLVVAFVADIIEKEEPHLAVLYSVRQAYKWTEQGVKNAKPEYYSEHQYYLGRDKRPLNQNIKVIKEIELK